MQDLHTAIDAMKQTKEYEFAESETDDASTAVWLICQAYNKTL